MKTVSFYRLAFRRIGAPFLILSAIWILTSDWLVEQFPESLRFGLNVGKGFAYVLLMAALATVLSARLLDRMARSQEARRRELSERLALYRALPGPVFTLDRQGRVSSWSQYFLDRTGFAVTEVVGRPADHFIAEDNRDDVRATIGRLLAGGDSESVEADLLTVDGNRLPHLFSASPARNRSGEITGIVGFGLDHSAARAERSVLQRHLAEIESVLDETIRAIGFAMTARDPYTAEHQQRLTQLACAIAGRMGLGAERIRGVWLAGQVLDIGKIAIPADLLNLPRRLTPVERQVVQDHVTWGHRILQGIPFSQPVATFVLQHHERLDGSGYPQGLEGEAILTEARILGIADAVEAMTAHRPYRGAMEQDAALAELRAGRGSLYDADAVDACLALFAEGFAFETGNVER